MVLGSTGVGTLRRRASELGCILDCVLDTGLTVAGTAATDNTAILNAFFALATATKPVCLEMDGASLTSGLVFPLTGNVTIIGFGRGTGFYQKSGANCDVIRNIPNALTPMDYGTTAYASTGSNVHLQNFRINGNGGTGYAQYPTSPGSVSGGTGNGNSSGKNRMGPSGSNGTLNADQVFCMTRFQGLSGVTIRDVYYENSCSFNAYFTQCSDVVIDGCRFLAFTDSSTVTETSTDGIHLSGNCRKFRIVGCRLRIGDDAIALNACEGYAGTISDLEIAGCTFDDCLCVLRTYTGGNVTGVYIDGVTFTGCTGNAQVVGFLSGNNSTQTVAAAVRNVKISDSTIAAPVMCAFGENMGAYSFDNVTWKPAPATAGQAPTVASGWMNTYGQALTIDSLSLRNCTVERNAKDSAPQSIIDLLTGAGGVFGAAANAVTLKRLTIAGLEVVDLDGSYSAMPALVTLSGSSTIGNLLLSAVDPTNVTALCSSATVGQIASIAGAAVLQTGWSIPDAQMANCSPYLRASSGKASVKVGGAVTAL